MNTQGGKNPFPNRLWLARKRRSLGQKQVAALIGKTVADVSRYECGIHLPELETLLALEVVYGTPVRLLFLEFYEQVRDQIKKRIASRAMLLPRYQALFENTGVEQEYCGYEEMLALPSLSDVERIKIRSHITRLMRRLTDI